MGDPAQPGTVVGPVIDADAQKKILGYIEQGRKEARLAWQAQLAPELAASGGYYVPPTVFVDVRPEHVIAREEIFGPVLAVMKARDLDEAFALANGADYALTGGLFSAVPAPSNRRSATSWSAISTSTAASPAPSSSGIRSAASRCRAAGPRPAARSICRTSCSPAPWQRTRCAGDSRHQKINLPLQPAALQLPPAERRRVSAGDRGKHAAPRIHPTGEMIP